MPHGHKVRIQCLRGFTVVGEELSECFRGRLLQQLGHCVPKSCSLNSTSLQHGNTAKLICPKQLPEKIKCQFGGAPFFRRSMFSASREKNLNIQIIAHLHELDELYR
uniref:Uncharacterized protein n=1 Tax=Meloidogyne enterolobii TaxID=390850 RepID=A0A6V7WG48_MELEN|nr:unnamed protein product [Meloidogyne enterolobii]